jgi:hypothetical protein
MGDVMTETPRMVVFTDTARMPKYHFVVTIKAETYAQAVEVLFDGLARHAEYDFDYSAHWRRLESENDPALD